MTRVILQFHWLDIRDRPRPHKENVRPSALRKWIRKKTKLLMFLIVH